MMTVLELSIIVPDKFASRLIKGVKIMEAKDMVIKNL